MKKTNQYHVVHNKDSGWDVKKANSQRATVNCNTKIEAVSAARLLSTRSGSEMVVHGVNGKIQYSNSYGNDPCPPKDKK